MSLKYFDHYQVFDPSLKKKKKKKKTPFDLDAAMEGGVPAGADEDHAEAGEAEEKGGAEDEDLDLVAFGGKKKKSKKKANLDDEEAGTEEAPVDDDGMNMDLYYTCS